MYMLNKLSLSFLLDQKSAMNANSMEWDSHHSLWMVCLWCFIIGQPCITVGYCKRLIWWFMRNVYQIEKLNIVCNLDKQRESLDDQLTWKCYLCVVMDVTPHKKLTTLMVERIPAEMFRLGNTLIFLIFWYVNC